MIACVGKHPKTYKNKAQDIVILRNEHSKIKGYTISIPNNSFSLLYDTSEQLEVEILKVLITTAL
jgi:hypothetical protein